MYSILKAFLVLMNTFAKF